MNTSASESEQRDLSLSQGQSEPPSSGPLSILLVNYNGAQYLGPCLGSIFRYAPAGTQIILEDNASTDRSLDIAEANIHGIEIVRSSRNLGFAAGNNLAGKRATGKFILLLNTDTELLEPIAPVVDWLEKHPAYGALTINMLDAEQKPSACTGRFPSPLRLLKLKSMLVSPETYGGGLYDVDWVQGSFILIRADVWHSLNGLDERYFMYAEDVDLCKRIWNAGYKCAYIPGYRYLHLGGFVTSRFPDQVYGLLLYVENHMAGLQRMVCRAMLLTGCIVRAGVFKAIGFLANRDANRAKSHASWCAFMKLMQRHRQE